MALYVARAASLFLSHNDITVTGGGRPTAYKFIHRFRAQIILSTYRRGMLFRAMCVGGTFLYYFVEVDLQFSILLILYSVLFLTYKNSKINIKLFET